jgi:hypothetical protein
MTPAELNQLTKDCPFVFHMAVRGSWPLIRAHGLLPANALAELFEVATDLRQALLSERRATGSLLTHPILGTATIRDQIPLLEQDLMRCLEDGLLPSDWYGKLNEQCFSGSLSAACRGFFAPRQIATKSILSYR